MSGGHWFDQQDPILSDINITPLVDVALVLLIIFMITAPMMVQGADVRLPRTEHMPSLSESQMIISVTAENQVLIDGAPIPLEEFEARVSPRVSPGQRVLFHGDDQARYGLVMQVWAILHNLGADVGAVIEPIPER